MAMLSIERRAVNRCSSPFVLNRSYLKYNTCYIFFFTKYIYVIAGDYVFTIICIMS